MKRMKNTIALILAVALMFSLTVTAFAADEKGSINITGVVTDDSVTYEIYKLLDLESYDTESGAYSYKVNDAWKNFFATDAAKEYFTVDEQNYATWINASEDSDTVVAAFAKLALDYAKENGIEPVKSSEKTEENPAGDMAIDTSGEKPVGIFGDLTLGYYLVDSSMGALCGLTTTNPDAYITPKNEAPTIDKQVKEDSTGQWGDTNSADIGQIVEFRTTINVHKGAENFVLHDKMSSGLTFKGVTKVEHVVPGTTDGHVEDASNYKVVTEGLEDADKGCTFEIQFTQEFCDSLEDNDKVIVYYTAMLNRNAVVAGDGNTNEAKLEFGEDHYTTEDVTTTKTYGFDLVKTDSQNKLLDGAEFRIYDAATGGKEVSVVLMDDGVTYRRARSDEESSAGSIVVKDGKVRVVGFDNGTYYLQETVTPEGYNSLSARQRFVISDANLDAVITDNVVSTGSGVHVVNKSGTMLPETGGMGTTLFICFGAIAVLGTGVLLVTKKRMGMIQD